MTKRDTIALFLLDGRNDYQGELRQQAEAACKRHGYKLVVDDAENRSNKQLAQIIERLRNPDRIRLLALLVHPVLDGMHADAAQEAVGRGIGWVLLNRAGIYLDELRRTAPAVPSFSIAPDQNAIGRLQADQVNRLLPNGGEVLCIVGPLTASSARNRLTGMQEVLEASSKIKVTTVRGDWSALSGEQAAMLTAIPAVEQGKTIHAIVAQNDAMAVGARQALLKAARDRSLPILEKIPILGCDGTQTYGRQKVKDRYLAATVLVPATSGAAIDELAHYAATGEVPKAEVLLPVESFPPLAEITPVK